MLLYKCMCIHLFWAYYMVRIYIYYTYDVYSTVFLTFSLSNNILYMVVRSMDHKMTTINFTLLQKVVVQGVSSEEESLSISYYAGFR